MAAATVAIVAVLASGCTPDTGDDAPADLAEPSIDATQSPSRAPTPESTSAASPDPSPSPSPSPARSPTAPGAPTTTPSPAAASDVPLRIERRTSDDATAGFAAQALEVLTDDRGWVRAGIRFVATDDAPYLLVLAEGPEVDRLCEPYDTGGQFSCQNGPVVALNADRWRTATPDWPGDLDSYRTYLVNHEIGHLLHLHHPSPQCPGPGLPAPVMLQQSTELGTCEASPWPLPWEVDLAAARNEPLAPPADHQVEDHQPSPPPEHQDFDHRAG